MAKNLKKRVAGLIALAFLSGPVLAAGSEGTWTAEIVPYLWAATIQGDTAAGDAESPVNPDYSLFTMENLSGAFMGAMRVSRGHWSWQLDTLHVDYQEDFDRQLIDTHIGVKGGFLEVAAGFRSNPDGNLEWLLGLRDVEFATEVVIEPGFAGKVKKSWLDPFVGLRYRYPLSDTWALRLRADVGGMNPSSRVALNGMVALEYAFGARLQGLAGYRYLELDFKESDFLLDISASGFALGLSLRY
jgi:hypothetical protein